MHVCVCVFKGEPEADVEEEHMPVFTNTYSLVDDGDAMVKVNQV